MKRVTYWPQAWLGLAANYGLVIGYLAVSNGRWDPPILILYTGSVAWTIVYDTIYAYQDVRDDIKVGIKSTALLFGPTNGRKILAGFAAVFWASLCLIGVQNEQGPWYFVISVGGAGVHLAWQLSTWKQEDWDSCLKTFMSNGNLGALIWFGLFVDYCVKSGDRNGGLITKFAQGF
ncbi:hypothetical protein AAF712_012170 [Marasmius tenuissimus]|uniref:Uncharacterized protein n=1 Tax=Marasmius tenuissimus TaxID=585030 RepID=A0ABR2ZJA9_9AGAR